MDKNFSCTVTHPIENSYFNEDLDDFRCSLATMTVILYNIKFGYICGFLLFLLGIISIFGGIKENYRWFILNQILWDSLLSYNFVCKNWIGLYFYKHDLCYSNKIVDSILEGIPTASYSSLLLLSLSRFICVYFRNFYNKITKNQRIFALIFVYNFIIIIFNLGSLANILAVKRYDEILCNQKDESERLKCFENPPYDFIFEFLVKIIPILEISSFSIPPFCLLFSILSTAAIISKLLKQFKFKLNNNKKDFYISLRITSVIFFQTLLYLFLFCIQTFYGITIKFFGWKVYINLPIWLWGVYGITWPPVIFNFLQIRIFIESLIILFLLCGYREAVIRFFKFLFENFGFKVKRNRNTIIPVTVIATISHSV